MQPAPPSAAVLALAMIVAAPSLGAQQPPGGCVDRANQPVVTVVNNGMSSSGMATIEGDRPVIYWNRRDMSRASAPTQLFIYLHECAHHRLGHVWKPEGARWEQEADCWAIQRMLERNLVRGRQVAMIQREMRRSRGDANHLGGAALLRSLDACIAIKTDWRAWARALDRLEAASADSFRSVQGDAVPAPSSRTGVFESEADLPGTYDCEITPARTVRCTIFAPASERQVDARFRKIERIVRRWLRPPWTATMVPRGPASGPSLRAADAVTGATLLLSAADDRELRFEFRAASAPPPAVRP